MKTTIPREMKNIVRFSMVCIIFVNFELNFLENYKSVFYGNWGTIIFRRALSIGCGIFQKYLKEFKFKFLFRYSESFKIVENICIFCHIGQLITCKRQKSFKFAEIFNFLWEEVVLTLYLRFNTHISFLN